MNSLLENIFIDSKINHINDVEEKFRLLAQPLLEYLQLAENLPLIPEKKLDELGIEEQGKSLPYLIKKLREVCLGSMNAYHPGYIGHMDSIPTYISVVGDLYASALNNNMLSYEMSPYFTQLQHKLIDYFNEKFGYNKETAGGVFLNGGTLCNLQALVIARNVKLNSYDRGINSLTNPILFTSELAHTSVQKGAMISGLGVDAVVKVQTDNKGSMLIADLEEKIMLAYRNNQTPFCVVATAGTTVIGSFDDLEAIAEIAKKYGLWFHVDAIYGGALKFSIEKEEQDYLIGIHQADSICFNPHKWLGVAKTSSLLLVKDKQVLSNYFQIKAPYMKEQKLFQNIGEISLQGSRQADVLKLWLSLLQLGEGGYGALIKRNNESGRYLMRLLSQYDWIEVAPYSGINIVCFRVKNQSDDTSKVLSLLLQEYLLEKQLFFFSVASFKERIYLRAVILNPFTTEERLEKLDKGLSNFYLENIKT